MLDLNETSKKCLKNCEERQKNGADISPETILENCQKQIFDAKVALMRWKNAKKFFPGEVQMEQLKVKLMDQLADIVLCALICAADNECDIEKAIDNKIKLCELRAQKIGDHL